MCQSAWISTWHREHTQIPPTVFEALVVLNWPRTLLGPVKSPILKFLSVVINNEQFSSSSLPPSTDLLIPYPHPPGLGRTNEAEALQSYERAQRGESGSRVSLSAAGLSRGKPLSESRPTRGGPAARPSICCRPHHLPVGVPRVRTGPAGHAHGGPP